MIRHYATCITLGLLGATTSTVTIAREYVEERAAPVYVEPAPAIVAGPTVVIGWHGDRYWDGHRWWERDEWNRHHHARGHEHHHYDHHDDHHDNHHG